MVAALLVAPVGVFAEDDDCSDRLDRDQEWIACETLP
jgi:hypothetical protein